MSDDDSVQKIKKLPSNPLPGRLFDSHLRGYNLFNSQRLILMAEDAVESAGAKAPAITFYDQRRVRSATAVADRPLPQLAWLFPSAQLPGSLQQPFFRGLEIHKRLNIYPSILSHQ